MRRSDLAGARRIVVKAGTNVLVGADGLPSLGRLYGLVEQLAALRREGRDVVLVSSGAVGLGAKRLGLDGRPAELAQAQACAAVGQGELMSIYQSGLGRLGVVAAQVLLTQDDFADATRRRNLRAALRRLLDLGVIPVINENDTVATHELERMQHFADNDKLGALVAAGLGADLLLILSDVDGLHTANPHRDPAARRIAEVHAVSPQVLALAQGGSSRGRGGMASKLDATRLATRAGVAVVLASGERTTPVADVLAGHDVGTLFHPGPRPDRDSLDPWLMEGRR